MALLGFKSFKALLRNYMPPPLYFPHEHKNDTLFKNSQ